MRAREGRRGAEGALPHRLGAWKTAGMYAAQWSVLVGPEGNFRRQSLCAVRPPACLRLIAASSQSVQH